MRVFLVVLVVLAACSSHRALSQRRIDSVSARCYALPREVVEARLMQFMKDRYSIEGIDRNGWISSTMRGDGLGMDRLFARIEAGPGCLRVELIVQVTTGYDGHENAQARADRLWGRYYDALDRQLDPS
jgi:hypothetical protein